MGLEEDIPDRQNPHSSDKDPNDRLRRSPGPRLYGPSEDRGLYKTIDGGKTWNKILYVDDKTGVIDMRMHPTDPRRSWSPRSSGFAISTT